MILENENYEIKIDKAVPYSVNSTDNKHYDLVIEVSKAAIINQTARSYEMNIEYYKTGEEKRVVFLVSYCADFRDNSALLLDHQLMLLFDHHIVNIDLSVFHYSIEEIDKPFGTYYDIYLCDQGYLLYGELELMMVNHQLKELWRYCTQDILTDKENRPLVIEAARIKFFDWDGNYHELDMNGKLCTYKKHDIRTIVIDVSNIKSPRQFQKLLKEKLQMPSFYGMNWDAYWDAITGLISLPDYLVLEGWNVYQSLQREDAVKFEEIMKKYNVEKYCHYCECVYSKYE